MGHPTIYPTGVTLYDPAKAWNGYTIFPAADLGALLIDMNGKEVQLWKGLQGFPNKLLPNGQVFGSTGLRAPEHSFQDQIDLVQVDWGAISFGGSAGWNISPTPDRIRAGMRANITTFSAKVIPSDITCLVRPPRTTAARRCYWCTQ